MKPLCTTALALMSLIGPATLAARAESPSTSSGFVDGAPFRELLDDTKNILEVNLDGAILKAMANKSSKAKDGDEDGDDENAKDLFAKLKSIHAVIGTVKGPSADALALVKKTDNRLAASGWQRIARITDETSTVSVLTHTVAEKIDGLVALIYDREDKELVFANLAGEIDVTKLGAIGESLDLPGLDRVPGAH
jgi:hypothetical protein